MTDPIRAALEEAWHESPSFLVDLPKGRVRQSLSLEEFAKANAAFLRALHARGITAIAEGNLPWLADYVLAAAKEKRE